MNKKLFVNLGHGIKKKKKNFCQESTFFFHSPKTHIYLSESHLTPLSQETKLTSMSSQQLGSYITTLCQGTSVYQYDTYLL